MIQDSMCQWLKETVKAGWVTDKHVLEVSSPDAGDSVREIIGEYQPASYQNLDSLCEVEAAGDLPHFYHSAFDLVISTGMLEHVTNWHEAMYGLITAVAPKGHLLIAVRERYSKYNLSLILGTAGLNEVTVGDWPDETGVFAHGRKYLMWRWPDACWEDQWSKIELDRPQSAANPSK